MTDKNSKGWISGTVVPGDGRGRSLGFPTANIAMGESAIKPAPAIYAAWARVLPEKSLLPAVVHIGPRPTFAAASPTFEVHIIRFPDQDLYDRTVAVLLVRHIREVVAFDSPAELARAIRQDIKDALDILQP